MYSSPSLTVYGHFATFDPRIDGLAADVGTRWVAVDCPVAMIKVHGGDTNWVIADDIGRQSSLVACLKGTEVSALYRGLARRPDLDMTPTHILTPDLANNRFTDSVAGDHLTKQGAGAGAEIARSPLYDARSAFGYEGRVTTGNASYWAAADGTKYNIATGPYLIAWVQSCTLDAAGAVSFGKWQPAPGADRGFAISINSFGGFGFLIDGNLLNLNTDTPFGTTPINDGRLRVFHHGLSNLAAGLGFVRTANIAPVTQAGQPGNFADVNALFGILQTDGAGARTAQGDQQYQKIIVWEGQAAENVIAYLDQIEKALQDQIEGVLTPVASAMPSISNVNPGTPARALNASFQPSLSAPTLCLYTVRILTNGNDDGRVELRADLGVNPPVTVRGRVRRHIAAGVFADSIEGQLCFLAPPGWYVTLATVTTAGAPVFSIEAQCEEAIL